MKYFAPATFALLLNLAALPAWAQREKPPTPEEIVAAARTIELDRSADARLDPEEVRLTSTTGKVNYTPIKPPAKFEEKMLADGLVVGEMRAEGFSRVLNNLMTVFVCKVGKKFETFIVKNGKLLKLTSTTAVTAVSAKAEKTKAPAKLKLIAKDNAATQRFLQITHQIGQVRVQTTIIVP